MKKTTKKAAAKNVKKVKVDQTTAPVKKAVKKNVVTTVPAEKVPARKVSAGKVSAGKASVGKTSDTKPVKENKLVAGDKNTERKLQENELETYRNMLLMIRARLRGDVSMMTDAALNKNRMEASGDLSVMPIHMADVGTDNFEQEQTLAFMQSESGILDLVEEALQRIDDGTYGICEVCENRIPKVRLNFLPFVSMCVKCAAQTQEDER